MKGEGEGEQEKAGGPSPEGRVGRDNIYIDYLWSLRNMVIFIYFQTIMVIFIYFQTIMEC